MGKQISFAEFQNLNLVGRHLSFERSRADINGSDEKAGFIDGPIAKVSFTGTVVHFHCDWTAVPNTKGNKGWKKVLLAPEPIDLKNWQIEYETEHADSRIRLTHLTPPPKGVIPRRRIFISPAGVEFPKANQFSDEP